MNYLPSVIKPSSTRLTGAVYTPTRVVEALVRSCKSHLAKNDVTVLEPSVGDGAFLNELLRVAGKDLNVSGVDIDADVVSRLRKIYDGCSPNVNLFDQEFLSFALRNHRAKSAKFDVIIGNPPFIRRHNFSDEIKAVLDEFSYEFCYRKEDLKNTWAAFVLASSHLVDSDGLMAFVLPYELLTVTYGQRLLKAISELFERVDVLVSDEKAFADIDQDAVILIAQKRSQAPVGAFLSKVPNFENLETKRSHRIDFSKGQPDGLELNSFLLKSDTKRLLSRISRETSTISDYAESVPGIVTAANDFFIRTRADAKQLGLSKYAKPILRKASFTSLSPIFRAVDFDALERSQPTAFLHLQGDRSHLSKRARDYVTFGETLNLHERYKCRNRKNWYEVPLVNARAGIFFKRSHSHPRLLINEANVLTTDTAYGVRVREPYSVQGLCYSFYNSLTLLFAEMNGRFYGGGVLELSPTEFRGLPLIYHEPSEIEFGEFLEVHERASGKIEEILDYGDRILKSNLDLTECQSLAIRAAWQSVRRHRLRHGGRN